MIKIGKYINKYKQLVNELHEMNVKLKLDSDSFSDELSEIDREVSDYEHYIELVNCDDTTKIKLFDDFHKALIKRRTIKENIAEVKFITEQLNSKLYKSNRSGGLYDSANNFANNRDSVKYVVKVRADLQDDFNNRRKVNIDSSFISKLLQKIFKGGKQ